jgi:PKD repeat protein
LTGTVSINFAGSVDASTFNTSVFRLGPATAGAVAVNGAAVTFTPSAPLLAGTTYTVTLATGVKDAEGDALKSDFTFTFTTVPPSNVSPPTAKVSTDRETGHADEAVAFDGTQSTDDGTITRYVWDFGDGVTAEGPTASHAFTRNGTFQVTLTCTDDAGNQASETRSFVVRPHWTYAVYMAADNTLAPDGIGDLLEMERIGSSKQLSVVVQAEFSQRHLRSQSGPIAPAAVGLTTYDTSRFAITKDASPNDTVNSVQTPIGSRDMGSNAALEEFINFVKTNHPADHTALVLWNHGSGWQGVCQDETAGSFMALSTLRTALRNTNAHFDVINFDACLMAMYETTFMLQGHADFIAFSEELEPGKGDPYDLILGRLAASPTMTASELAQTIATKFREFYAAPPENGAQSITKSAVDMSKFADADAAVGAFATSLTAALQAERPAIEQSRDASQVYSFPGIHDLVDFIAQLRTRTQNAELLANAQAVETAVTALVIANEFLTGNRQTPEGAPANMDRSRGLSILIPRADEFRDTGSASFAAYQSLAGDTHPAWIDFVQVLITGNNQPPPQPSAPGQFAVAVVWGDASADVDLYVFEPNGEVAAPWLGSVSTNGFLSGDSAQTGQALEAYQSRETVDRGTYSVLINLFNPGASVSVPVEVYLMDPSSGLNDFTLVSTVTVDPFFPAPFDWFEDATETNLVLTNFYSDWKLLLEITR